MVIGRFRWIRAFANLRCRRSCDPKASSSLDWKTDDQVRFKSFPIPTDGHLPTVTRYPERNPILASLVELAEDWQWSSAYTRCQRADERRWLAIPVDPPLPRNWRLRVNKVATEAELNALRRDVKHGIPFGDANGTKSSAVRLGLETTTQPRQRPKKET